MGQLSDARSEVRSAFASGEPHEQEAALDTLIRIAQEYRQVSVDEAIDAVELELKDINISTVADGYLTALFTLAFKLLRAELRLRGVA